MTAELGPSLVIGGGSGVGRGVALALAEAGAVGIVADRDIAAARQTAVEAGGVVRAAEVDVTDPRSLHSLAAQVETVELRTLVTTVGAIDSLPIRELDDERWQWAWEMNVLSAIHVVEVFRDQLARNAPSTLVLTGSGSGLHLGDRDPDLALYTTTKAALIGYASSVRKSLADDGVQLCLFVPHGVRGRLAETSALARSERFSEPSDPRGQPQTGRVLTDPLDAGRLLVRGIERGATLVSNSPAPFADALHDFAAYWQSETAKAVGPTGGPQSAL